MVRVRLGVRLQARRGRGWISSSSHDRLGLRLGLRRRRRLRLRIRIRIRIRLMCRHMLRRRLRLEGGESAQL